MIGTCKHCGSEFITFKSYEARRPSGGFCSIACWMAHKDRRRVISCLHCGRTLVVPPGIQIKRKYCSSECAKLAGGRPRKPKEQRWNYRICPECGEGFLAGRSHLGPTTYCSRKCFHLSLSRSLVRRNGDLLDTIRRTLTENGWDASQRGISVKMVKTMGISYWSAHRAIKEIAASCATTRESGGE